MKRRGRGIALVARLARGLAGCAIAWSLVACANASRSGASAQAASAEAAQTNKPYGEIVREDRPIALYRLAERSGPIARDASGNGVDGSYVDRYTLGRPALLTGDPATSASFPKGYVTAHPEWTNRAVTAECWVRPTAADLQGAPRIISNAWTDHDGTGYMLWLSNGTAAFNTGWSSQLGTFALEANRAYYLAGTYDRATGVTLYIDGVAVSHSNPGFIPSPQTGDAAGATYIGVLLAPANGGFVNFFQGDIGDCAVYDRALSPERIAAHYGAGAKKRVIATALAAAAATPPPPPATPAPRPIAYDARRACIAGRVYTNNVLPDGAGEFGSHGFDREWWGRTRGNPIGGHEYNGFQTSWGRRQYDTYFGDQYDGLPGGHDPFRLADDTGAAGSPRGLRIAAVPMPPELADNPAVGGAHWYSGVLDTPVDLRYGFFVARVRLPAPRPGMSPAWWLLSNNGVPQGPHGPLSGEWDIQEMFGNDLGDGMNAGSILWNSGADKLQNWGGTYDWPLQSTPSADYHDYGALIAPGGAPIGTNYYGSGGPGYAYGTANTGITNYLDGVPLRGHTGGADITGGVSWKELMLMFQVGAQGGWLGSPAASDFPAYYWVQWVRVYRPTTGAC